ncbi:hypothetical protein LV779_18100 [Streptomyces thinghirensis]|nr:hypothetical protein [Streptomyces thinghirensis]
METIGKGRTRPQQIRSEDVISGIGGVPQQPRAPAPEVPEKSLSGSATTRSTTPCSTSAHGESPLRRVPRVARLVRHRKCGVSALGQDGQGV